MQQRLLYDSAAKLARFEHPPIGVVEPLGPRPVWLGWLMILALAWRAIPSVSLGQADRPVTSRNKAQIGTWPGLTSEAARS